MSRAAVVHLTFGGRPSPITQSVLCAYDGSMRLTVTTEPKETTCKRCLRSLAVCERAWAREAAARAEEPECWDDLEVIGED